MSDSNHFDADGRPVMVDVSAKPVTLRRAVARGYLVIPADLLESANPKGDLIAIAELAGIMAAKRTADLIPLCHPLGLDSVSVVITRSDDGLTVEAEARTTARTGVEMEAMTAVSVACLTLYDMLKASARDLRIDRIELVEKHGGKSGSWRRE